VVAQLGALQERTGAVEAAVSGLYLAIQRGIESAGRRSNVGTGG
jgi:hypothetical protein